MYKPCTGVCFQCKNIDFIINIPCIECHFKNQTDIFHDILGKHLENIEASTQKKAFKTFSKMFSQGFQNIYMT